MVSSQLHRRGNSPRYLFDKRLGGPQSRSGRGGEEKNSCPSRESNPDRPARILVAYSLHFTVQGVWPSEQRSLFVICTERMKLMHNEDEGVCLSVCLTAKTTHFS
jgi:hypothetical protein